jgi:hypothetical protein
MNHLLLALFLSSYIIELMKKIATLIKSCSHLDYVAQVLNPKEQADIKPNDYQLGRFLRLGLDTVGVVYDTELFNPNSLSMSTQKEEIGIFAPDLQNEVDVLLKVLLLGKFPNNQKLPTETLEAGLEVYQMNHEEIKNFHVTSDGKVQVRYLLNLNNFGNKLSPGLFNCISGQLKGLLSPNQFKVIEVIERDLLWSHLCRN